MMLGKAGLEPDHMDGNAQITVPLQEGGLRVTESPSCEAEVPGIDRASGLQESSVRAALGLTNAR